MSPAECEEIISDSGLLNLSQVVDDRMFRRSLNYMGVISQKPLDSMCAEF